MSTTSPANPDAVEFGATLNSLRLWTANHLGIYTGLSGTARLYETWPAESIDDNAWLSLDGTASQQRLVDTTTVSTNHAPAPTP